MCSRTLLAFSLTILASLVASNFPQSSEYLQYEPVDARKCDGTREPYRPGDLKVEELETYFKECSQISYERENLERRLAREGKVIHVTERVADISNLRRIRTDPTIRKLELKQLPFQYVSDRLSSRYCISDQDLAATLPLLPAKGQYHLRAKNMCQQDVFNMSLCNADAKYRTADGSCNNLIHRLWGANGICFRRLLPARYSNGVSAFRESVVGGRLPSAREVSRNIHSHLNRPTNAVNHMYMFFGQFLAHEISQTPASTTVGNLPIECCKKSGDKHPQCAPVPVQPDDPFYAQFGIRCINFVRSAPCLTCNLGPREQANQVTAFIDGSVIYGNTLEHTLRMRTRDGTGRLRSERTAFGDFLPRSSNPLGDKCSFVNSSEYCFEGGDSRMNQHTTLASLHTIFFREHNRLAEELKRFNPQWDDETTFQEARRIVGAQLQVIAYNEYLPLTIGSERMTFFSLWTSPYPTSYDPTRDPSLDNEFATAAFRFAHSLVNGIITQTPRDRSGNLRLLRNEFSQPFELRLGLVGPLLQGVSRSAAQWFDRHLVPDVTKFLQRIRGSSVGLDLATVNIHRGRDHGLATYAEAVEFCSEYKLAIRQFSDLSTYGIMSYINVRLLELVYKDVRDVDLWTGILSETVQDSGVVGPTTGCILGTQFSKLKYGDRFYFEHQYQSGSFKHQQIQELKKTTLTQIVCMNSDATQMPLNAMMFPSISNPLIFCQNMRGPDLSYWKA